MSFTFNNVTTTKDLKESLIKVFTELDDILVDHAGPFATNTVIGSKWRQHNDADEFTKDGIKILRHLLVDDDPIARFAVRMARFIGIAVDKRCHDGTTTSMLLFCRMALLAISKMDSSIYDKDRYKWQKDILRICELCLKIIDDLKITEDDLFERAKSFGIETTIEDVRAATAFHMAMISSKGDYDLSEKIAKIIKHSPKKIYGMYNTDLMARETEERYILRKQEYDISVNANLWNRADYNHLSDTQYLSEDTVIFATGNDIVTKSWEAEFLTAFISSNTKHRMNLLSDFGVEKPWEELHEGKKRLIILTPMMNDHVLQEQIMMFNLENPSIKISGFNIQVTHQVRTTFNKTLHYMAGVPVFQDVMMENAASSLIGLNGPTIKAHLVGNVLALYNLYEKTGEVFHPFYKDPDAFEDYTKFCKETEDLIKLVTDNVTNPALESNDLNSIVYLYRALTCQEIYDIDVGGSIHEQYANSTVYEDAMGAALSAIEDGVVLGGYAHLAIQIKNHPANFVETMQDNLSEILSFLVADTTRSDISHIKTLYDELLDKWSFIVADKNEYLFSANDDIRSHVDVETLDDVYMEEFLKCSGEVPVLLQAWSGYQEQFKRFRDILPKLANTTDIADMRIKDASDVR
jgi:hypothetical protein